MESTKNVLIPENDIRFVIQTADKVDCNSNLFKWVHSNLNPVNHEITKSICILQGSSIPTEIQACVPSNTKGFARCPSSGQASLKSFAPPFPLQSMPNQLRSSLGMASLPPSWQVNVLVVFLLHNAHCLNIIPKRHDKCAGSMFRF